MLGKLPVPGRSTNLDYSSCACNRCGWGVVWTFFLSSSLLSFQGRVAQSVGHLTRKSGVLGSIPGLATYFRFFFRFFKKGSYQLLAKVCARSTG